MGQSTDAILIYGYDLGGPGSGWKLKDGVDEWDEITLPWVTQEKLDEIGFEQCVADELEKFGITGVTVESHCSVDYPMYVIGVNAVRAHRGYPKVIARATVTPAEAETLSRAMSALGLHPEQELPALILCSDWG